ncbi:MAG: hypothetical protein ACI9MR_002432 [Myxococcota bacterium]|jgi:hypothetical protein
MPLHLRPSSALRPTGIHLLLLALSAGSVLTLGACEDATSPADDTDAQVDTADGTEAPSYTVAIVSSSVGANAPLDATFSVDVTGNVSAALLTYAWYENDTLVGDEPTLSRSYFRAQTVVVRLETNYFSETGDSVSASDSFELRVRGCADLTFGQVSLQSPAEVAPGDPLTLRVGTLANEGDQIDADFDVAVALSIDDRWDPAEDLVIARWTVPGMASGLASDSIIDYAEQMATLGADVAEGTYFVFLVADIDEVVNECLTSNNVQGSTNNLIVELGAGLKSDVLITELSVPSVALDLGDRLNYQFLIKNEGEGDAGQFRVGFWLSTDQVLDEGEDLIVLSPNDDGARLQRLDAGAQFNFFKDFIIPDTLADGTYWMIGRADVLNQLSESDEGNNLTISATQVTVENVVPDCYDLAFVDFDISPQSTYWDGTIQLTATVRNNGSQPTPAAWSLRALLSLSPSVTQVSGTSVGTWFYDALLPGEEVVVQELIPISNQLPVLPHYVGAILDPNGFLTECDENNNNAQFESQVSISAVASVDVEVGAVVYHPTSVTAGETIKVESRLTNDGTSGATAFRIGVVLSPDANISVAGIRSGADIVIHSLAVSSIDAEGTLDLLEDVVVPETLDHLVGSWWVAVVADIDGLVGQDENAANNVQIAATPLTVLGATGGCYEDDREEDDSQTSATLLETGTATGFGSCGDEDWFRVTVPAGDSVFVDVVAQPVASVSPVSSELIVELRTATGTIVDESDRVGPEDSVRAYAVAEGATYYVRVRGAEPITRAQYDVTVGVPTPAAGVDVLVDDVIVSPAVSYPGGFVRVKWRELNLGRDVAGSHLVRIWASRDTQLDPGVDFAVAELSGASLASLAARDVDETVLLPATLLPGDWWMLVEIDADADLTESNEDNNVGFGDPVFVDPEQVCADDDLEPNDRLEDATPLELVDGMLRLAGSVVCPGIDDWYVIDLAEGDAFDIEANYTHISANGLLQLELFDTSQVAALVSEATSGDPDATIPWVWDAGRYYIRISNKASGSAIGPYTYELEVSVTPGDPADACTGDTYEPNTDFAAATAIGCGALTATLCNTDLDFYRIDAIGGEAVNIAMSNALSQARMRLYTGDSGFSVRSRSGNGSMNYTRTDDGPLYLRVDPRSGPTSMTVFDYTLTVDGVAGVDLAAVGVSLSADSVAQGDDVRVAFEIVNGCTVDAGPFTSAVYLSRDPVLSPEDVRLRSFESPTGATAGETLQANGKVGIPSSTAAGSYHLIVVVDADAAVVESNEANNRFTLPVRVIGVCAPDALEPNDVADVADMASIPVVAPPGVTGLSACPYDPDWFSIEVPHAGTVTVSARFAHANGDLDLRLYDLNLSSVVAQMESASESDDEMVVYTTSLATTLWVRVAGFGGASAPYDLEVTLE